jgi:FtsH-binding integral membrane protein
MYENVIQSGKTLAEYVSGVFMWMFWGLLLTAATAFIVAETGLYIFFVNPVSLIVSVIAEFALVLYISGAIKRDMSSSRARIAFMIYAIINGLTLSTIFLIYDIAIIYQAFFATALTFGIMAVYGNVTKKDLSRLGSIFLMGLIGMIIATITNYIFGFFGLYSTQLELILSYVTIFIFLGLTAWDTQKIKAYYYGTSGDEALSERLSIVAALGLYLDFINLFLTILRIFGHSRD